MLTNSEGAATRTKVIYVKKDVKRLCDKEEGK